MSIRRTLATLIASALTASSLGLAVATPAAAAASITLDKKAPASVLLGDPIPYELTATNPDRHRPAVQRRASLTSYRPGSSTSVRLDPASAGEPTDQHSRVAARPCWCGTNVTDLQANSSFTLIFSGQTQGAPARQRSSPSTTTRQRRRTDQRTHGPEVQRNGTPIADPGLTQQSDTTDTARDPFVVEKENTNSPEGELLRGVHKNRVRLHTHGPQQQGKCRPTDITVTDYLPAGMEFLGCGDQDNCPPGPSTRVRVRWASRP